VASRRLAFSALLDLADEAAGLLVELLADQVSADASRPARGYDAGRRKQACEGEESFCLHEPIVGASAGRVLERMIIRQTQQTPEVLRFE
jgi:hypothetical protein